ncbi:MAG: DUF1573 domain-containing protein [bacterium]
MGKKIIIGLILVLAFSIYGYFSAVPGVEDNEEDQPKIEINPQTFDFGEVEYGQILEYTFKIKNLSNQILEISKVTTSCGCTTAQISQEKINPQEEIELKVIYDTGAMGGTHAKGDQERIIYIKSNDPINPQTEVTISAYVK